MAKRPKRASAYHRRGASREPYDVVLIVCEGRKTEPNYLNGLRVAFGLSSVNVKILPPPGTDPMTVVNFAIQQLERDPDYDRAYCVFDRDGHANFADAVRAVANSDYGKQQRLFAITSIPCFEIWLLLHYRYGTAAFTAVGGRSACDRVITELRRHHPDYAKGRESIFAELSGSLQSALRHAAALERHNEQTNSSNPSTRVHMLVDYLMKLKNG